MNSLDASVVNSSDIPSFDVHNTNVNCSETIVSEAVNASGGVGWGGLFCYWYFGFALLSGLKKILLRKRKKKKSSPLCCSCNFILRKILCDLTILPSRVVEL